MASKALYLQTAFVGDLLLAIPTLKHLREKLQVEEIHLICRKGIGSILKKLELVDVIYEVEKTKGLFSSKTIDTRYKDVFFDYLICPHESLTSAKLAHSAQSAFKVSYRQWWNAPFFSQRLPRPMELPEAFRQLSLLTELDSELKERLKGLKSSWLFMNGQPIPSWAAMQISKEVLQKISLGEEIHCQMDWSKKNIFLAPGSVWPTKRWTTSGFSELAQECVKKNYNVVLIGAPGEEDIALQVEKSCPEVINLCGKTRLEETLALFAHSSENHLVCNDSGAMHLGAIANIPTTAIFGPTTLELGYRPWNDRAQVLEKKLSCRPCGKHGGKKCPIGTHECMTSISVAEVMSSIETSEIPSH